MIAKYIPFREGETVWTTPLLILLTNVLLLNMMGQFKKIVEKNEVEASNSNNDKFFVKKLK